MIDMYNMYVYIYIYLVSIICIYIYYNAYIHILQYHIYIYIIHPGASCHTVATLTNCSLELHSSPAWSVTRGPTTSIGSAMSFARPAKPGIILSIHGKIPQDLERLCWCHPWLRDIS